MAQKDRAKRKVQGNNTNAGPSPGPQDHTCLGGLVSQGDRTELASQKGRNRFSKGETSVHRPDLISHSLEGVLS